jgi:hypothetical protein
MTGDGSGGSVGMVGERVWRALRFLGGRVAARRRRGGHFRLIGFSVVPEWCLV